VTVTLTDVARHAGVSLATASRAFGEPDRLAAATLQKVRAAAAELGYEPTSSAPPEETTIGVIVPDVASPVYAQLLKGIHTQAWHGRHRIVLFDTDEDLRREREQIARASALDGMLLCSPRLPPAEVLGLTGETPFVVLNRIIENARCVVMDTERGPHQAVEHLVALGHRHIAYAAGPEYSWADVRRGDAVASACTDFDVRFTRLTHQAASIQGGRAAAATAIASGASAVIAYNDLIALGIEAGIEDLGLRCPEDLSIIGNDDIEIASARRPGLTTVRLAINRSGSIGVETLLKAIEGDTTIDVVELPSQLIVRASTAAPKQRP
jgi:LacI family transcriptional regulator